MHTFEQLRGVGAIVPESPSARKTRIELALVVGGTLGAATIFLLDLHGKRTAAKALTGAGIIAGGFVAAWRVLEEERYRVYLRNTGGMNGLGCASCGGQHG